MMADESTASESTRVDNDNFSDISVDSSFYGRRQTYSTYAVADIGQRQRRAQETVRSAIKGGRRRTVLASA